MSTDYWSCTGFGVKAEDLLPYMNAKKCVKFLRNDLPNMSIDYFDFDINNYIYGEPFSCFAEILAECDETGSLTYGNTGYDGYSYLYYPPQYPWTILNKDPLSKIDVLKRIFDAVSKVCDIDLPTLTRMVDYIDEIGYN